MCSTSPPSPAISIARRPSLGSTCTCRRTTCSSVPGTHPCRGPSHRRGRGRCGGICRGTVLITDRDIACWRLHSQPFRRRSTGPKSGRRSLLAVQAENLLRSRRGVATRTAPPRQRDLADAIADGRVLRTHVLRPTWHYVHADDAVAARAHRLAGAADRRPTTAAAGRPHDRAHRRRRGDSRRGRPIAPEPILSGALADRGVTGQQLMLARASRAARCAVQRVPRAGEHGYRSPIACPRRAASTATRPYRTRPALLHLTRAGHRARPRAYWASHPHHPDIRRGIGGAADKLASFEHDGRRFWHAPGDAPHPRHASPVTSVAVLR